MIRHCAFRSAPVLRVAALCLGLWTLAACTWQQQLLLSLLPDGIFTVPLANLQGIDMSTQQHLADLEGRRDWAGVLAVADRNLAKDPRSAEWHFARGYALGRLDRWREAVSAFEASVLANPHELEGWHMLAQAERFSGERGRALKTLARTLAISRESHVTFHLLGENHRELGQYTDARAAYREALRLAPDFPEALFGIGQVEASEGDRAEQERIASRLDALHPPLAARLRTLR